jgi:hypothetical protein
MPAAFSVLLLIIILLVIARQLNFRPQYTAVICQQFFSWAGIFLLSPVFMPEQNDNIEETVVSKAMPIKAVYLIRLVQALFALVLFTAGFIFLLFIFGSEIEFARYFIHTFAVAFLLGSLGFAGTRFAGNISVGYLIAFGFYIVQMFLPVDRIESAEYFFIFTLIRETRSIIPMYICAFILVLIPFVKKH